MALENLTGEVLDGKYQIERQLGKGGMGAVYLATHLGTDRPVAVKVIMPQYTRNDEFVERFRREAKAAGRMRHPNIVDVTDFGFGAVDGDRVAYLVMEYLDGCTLADILAEENQLPVDWVVDILEQTCSAVDEAHQLGIVHRDLKPENIWLEPNRRSGYTVKVLDFGLAKQGDPLPASDAATSLPGGSRGTMPSAQATDTAVVPGRDTNIIGQTPLSGVDQGATQAMTPGASATQAIPSKQEAATRIVEPAGEATPAAPEEAATLIQPPPDSTPARRTPAAPVYQTASSNEAAEARTLIQTPRGEAGESESRRNRTAAGEEAATQILIGSPDGLANRDDDDSSATRLMPPSGAGTGSLDRPHTGLDRSQTGSREATPFSGTRRTADERNNLSTASAGGITRIGSILGTPLYMSPEQCRGETLDSRSDIYSLGIIAYQMLAGDAPFTGEISDVLRGHMEAPPPPLRERRKKLPKRTARIIMSALAKNPADRPATATSFANALRASSEDTGKLLRRAFAIYSEHFPVFFRLSLVSYLPVILLTALFLSKDLLLKDLKVANIVISSVLALVMFITQIVVSSVINGVIIWFVVQLAVAPLRPLRVRHALRSLKQRLKRLVTTEFRILIVSFLGFCLLVVPGVIYFFHATLAAPAVVMENLKGRAAVQRSKALVKRARLTVIAILLFELLIPSIIGGFISSALGVHKRPEGQHVSIGPRISEIVTTTINIFLLPLMATLTALLYLKVRQLGGETLTAMLSQFESHDAPQTRWQQRMRERLNSSAATRSA